MTRDNGSYNDDFMNMYRPGNSSGGQTCPHCGERIAGDDVFCGSCGGSIEPPKQPENHFQQNSYTPNPKSRKKSGLVVLGLVVLAIVAFIFLASKLFSAGFTQGQLLGNMQKFAIFARTLRSNMGMKYWENQKSAFTELAQNEVTKVKEIIGEYKLNYISNDEYMDGVDEADKFVLIAMRVDKESGKEIYYADENGVVWVATPKTNFEVDTIANLTHNTINWNPDDEEKSRLDNDNTKFEKLIDPAASRGG